MIRKIILPLSCIPYLIFLTLLQSCSLSPSENGRQIKIHFDFHSLPPPLQLLFYNSFDAVRIVPETVSDFSCLAVNVMGEGINPQSGFINQNSLGDHCAYSGITSAPISNKQEKVTIDLAVPSGKNRTIQIIGINDPRGLYCGLTGELGKSVELSSLKDTFYEVGRTSRDLFLSQTIEIQNSYNALSFAEKVKRDVSCPQASPSPSLDPAPTITTVSPNKGISTVGNTVTVTVTGTHFKSGAIVCFENLFTCNEAVIISSTELSCSVPSHAAGLVNVMVQNPDGQTIVKENAYTYIDNTNLFFWYKADAIRNGAGNIPADNDPVPSWMDSSGNGFNLTKFGIDNSDNFPKFKSSIVVGTVSKPAMKFVFASGIGNRLTASIPLADRPSPSEYTLFVVARQTANPSVGTLLGLSSNTNNSFFIGNPSGNTLWFGNDSNYSYWTAVWPDAKFFRWTVLVTDSTTINGVTLYNQDSSNAIAPFTGNIDGRGGTWDRITIGDCSYPCDKYFVGYIAEAIGYKVLITNPKQLLIEDYLKIKYGL